MADQRKGGIPWTDRTWNPIRGCSRVSRGCEHCYAERQAARFADVTKTRDRQFIDKQSVYCGCVWRSDHRLDAGMFGQQQHVDDLCTH